MRISRFATIVANLLEVPCRCYVAISSWNCCSPNENTTLDTLCFLDQWFNTKRNQRSEVFSNRAETWSYHEFLWSQSPFLVASFEVPYFHVKISAVSCSISWPDVSGQGPPTVLGDVFGAFEKDFQRYLHHAPIVFGIVPRDELLPASSRSLRVPPCSPPIMKIIMNNDKT